ncbi:hypothetical protein GBAR_LOCUS13515 [Geodia barretti]|uniref:Uncharacterized protein n=1 Tax=Geodia barretti TaxID=519541 RepID=A0AA35WQW7_GEOBA|nr:hypothetical protein GBAR_LOCUS13515 [Geodia barretti]
MQIGLQCLPEQSQMQTGRSEALVDQMRRKKFRRLDMGLPEEDKKEGEGEGEAVEERQGVAEAEALH